MSEPSSDNIRSYKTRKLSASHVELLIEEVRKRQVCWNPKLKESRNFEIKEDAWRQIGAIVNITGNQARLAFTALRDKYRRECEIIYKQNRFRSNSTASKRPWEMMERMSFLKDSINPRKTVSNNIDMLSESSDGSEIFKGYTDEIQNSCETSIVDDIEPSNLAFYDTIADSNETITPPTFLMNGSSVLQHKELKPSSSRNCEVGPSRIGEPIQTSYKIQNEPPIAGTKSSLQFPKSSNVPENEGIVQARALECLDDIKDVFKQQMKMIGRCDKSDGSEIEGLLAYLREEYSSIKCKQKRAIFLIEFGNMMLKFSQGTMCGTCTECKKV